MQFLYLLPTIIFYALSLTAIYVSLSRGDEIDKKIAFALLFAAVATTLSQADQPLRLNSIKFLIIDSILFSYVLLNALKSKKYWPLVSSASILSGVTSHLIPILYIPIPELAYFAANNIWGYICVTALITGVLIEKSSNHD